MREPEPGRGRKEKGKKGKRASAFLSAFLYDTAGVGMGEKKCASRRERRVVRFCVPSFCALKRGKKKISFFFLSRGDGRVAEEEEEHRPGVLLRLDHLQDKEKKKKKPSGHRAPFPSPRDRK